MVQFFLSALFAQEAQPYCVPTDDSGGFESGGEVLGSKTWSIVAESRAFDAKWSFV